MDSVKVTPLILFLILLAVLVISVFFGYRAVAHEGFTAYQFAKQPVDTVWIPQYTKNASNPSVYKLYDNLFFDNKNGNLIEIDASGNGSTSNYDNSGATITNVYVTKRANPAQTSRYQIDLSGGSTVSQDTTESLIASLPNSYQSFKYVTQSPNTDTYTAFYIPWNDSTYIHVINANAPARNVGTFLFGPANTVNNKIYPTDASLNLSSSVQDSDPSNNQVVYDGSYNSTRPLYQISQNVRFDTQNANLILKTTVSGQPALVVYDRNGTPSQPITGSATVTNQSTAIQNVTFTSFTISDTQGQNVVLYAAVGKKTVVALIRQSSGGYSLANVKRFSELGLDIGTQSAASATTPATTTTNQGSQGNQNNMSDFYRMYWFMQTQGMPNVGQQGIPGTNRFSEDYLLKTQIVPPVCPTCPSCPACTASPASKVVCSNCGGQGGSGTLDISGSTIVQNTKTNVAGAVSNLGRDVGGVANNVVNTTGGLLTGAAKGTKDVATDVVIGTKNVATDVVVGTRDLVTGAAGEAKNLLKSAGSGVKDILTQGQGQGQGYGQGQGQYDDTKPKEYGRWQQGDYSDPNLGTNNQPAMDQYSYYGSLPAKQATNFMPVTADFSAFAR
jgi:hypothetical protein